MFEISEISDIESVLSSKTILPKSKSLKPILPSKISSKLIISTS